MFKKNSVRGSFLIFDNLKTFPLVRKNFNLMFILILCPLQKIDMLFSHSSSSRSSIVSSYRLITKLIGYHLKTKYKMNEPLYTSICLFSRNSIPKSDDD